MQYYPGEVVLRMSDVVVINKVDSARQEDIARVHATVQQVVPNATVIEADSPISVDDPSVIHGKRVLVVEDGPTLTHGGMKFGAGTLAARAYGAAEIIDPRPYLTGQLKDTFAKYPEIGKLLPAMGYGEDQLRDLEQTIAGTECDSVIIGTPIDLNRVITIRQPSTRVTYELKEVGKPDLEVVVDEFLKQNGLASNMAENTSPG